MPESILDVIKRLLTNALLVPTTGFDLDTLLELSRQPATGGPRAAVQERFPETDKRLHALSSLFMAERMGVIPAGLLGVLKEGFDLLGGQAERGDLEANAFGLNLARQRESRPNLMSLTTP